MKSIVIVPTTLLDSGIIRDQTMHLLLSHLLVESPDYFNFYKSRRDQGDYLILDNSAHETGRGGPIDLLITQAVQLGAQELVMPDVLFDCYGTIDLTRDAFLQVVGQKKYPSTMPTSWMIVPQGETYNDWKHCLTTLLRTWEYCSFTRPQIFQTLVLGMSKDYSEKFDNFRECLWDLSVAQMARPGTQIHLLGWPKPLWTLPDISGAWGDRIRSTDSSRPITFGISKIVLNPLGIEPTYPKRPSNFFSYDLDETQYEIAYLNSLLYRNLVGSKSWWQEISSKP